MKTSIVALVFSATVLADIRGPFKPMGPLTSGTRAASAQEAKLSARSGGCVAALPGLVGWWRGEDNAEDVLQSNESQPAEGMSYVKGKVGTAFNFNAPNQYVKVQANPDFNRGSGFTIELWMYPALTAGYPIVEWNDGKSLVGTHLWVWGGTGRLFLNCVATDKKEHILASGPGIIVPNTSQHIAATYDSTSGVARLFRNGIVMAEDNLGEFAPQTTYDLWFGRRPTTSQTYKGALDEIGIYNRALDVKEIQSIYNAGAAGKCAPPN